MAGKIKDLYRYMYPEDLSKSDGACESDKDPKPEIGRDLCRVERVSYKMWSILKVEYGGYKKDILTENLNDREKAVLICKVCQGIMKEACVSESEEQFCLCCKRSNTKEIPDISVRKMVSSLKCSCPLIERGCVWLGTLKDCENHLDMCGYVREACKLECGVVLGRDNLRIHEKEKCPQRTVECDLCKKDLKSCELNEHLDECPMMIVSCDLCGKVMCREELEQHVDYYCGMVLETCKLGCGVKLTRDELKIHEKDTCVERRKQCEHCYQSIYLTDIQSHLADYCPDKVIECPFVEYRCLERLKRKDIAKHLEEKETKHLRLKLTDLEDLVTKQSEEINEQTEIILKQSEEFNKQNGVIQKEGEKINKQNREISKQREEMKELKEVIRTQSEAITKQTGTILAQTKETKQLKEVIRTQSEEITKQNEKIDTQSEEITKQNEKIDTQSEEIIKQNEEMRMEKANTSQQIEIIYSITDTTKIVIQVRYPSETHSHHEVAGYKFAFKFLSNREMRIVFQGTGKKHDRPFIAKCQIVFLSRLTINCGIIEVKQKDLTRGCERVITTLSEEDIEKYSEQKLPHHAEKDLTLEVYLTKL